MSLFDIHAHLDMMEESVEVTIQKAKEAGVTKIFTIGTEPADHAFVLETARKYYPDVVCTLGVHPHHGAIYTDEVGAFIEKNIQEKALVAIGEIGLDYYYTQSPVEAQKESFIKQMELAARHQMPVEIHTRDAELDTVEILKKFKGQVHGVIHCFTGTKWLAEQCLDLGYNISFSGVVTFKNAHELRETCRFVPLDRMHVETDAPFLTPVPLRGKKNVPAYVVHTARFVAELKGISFEELCRITSANARQLFPRLI